MVPDGPGRELAKAFLFGDIRNSRMTNMYFLWTSLNPKTCWYC